MQGRETMIWMLRNIGVHLWIVSLIAIPACFYVIPGLSGVFPEINPVTAGLVVITGLGGVIGFLMDAAAEKAVMNLIKEAQTWERAGIFTKAEKNYIKAVRIYDTFLLWPFSAKKTARKISAALGRATQEASSEAESSFFHPAKKTEKKIEIGKNIQAVTVQAVVFLKQLIVFIGSALRVLGLSAGKGFAYLKAHEKVRFYLKAGVLGVVSVGLLLFMVNTLSHMVKSKAVEKEKIKIELQVPKPFTIQVSAYLKQKYADRYADGLKKKGIDAIVKKVDGGGKTWFVVRVSEFMDKKSAADYGQKLKRQKIIDDFFVNNK